MRLQLEANHNGCGYFLRAVATRNKLLVAEAQCFEELAVAFCYDDDESECFLRVCEGGPRAAAQYLDKRIGSVVQDAFVFKSLIKQGCPLIP